VHGRNLFPPTASVSSRVSGMTSSASLMRAAFGVLLTVLLWGRCARAQDAAVKDLQFLATYVQSGHRAPFHRDGALLPRGTAQNLLRSWSQASNTASVDHGENVRVNRDHNPWPKVGIAAAIDPANGNNYVVMSNDFRENFDHMFFHVSKTGGATWTDDSMVGGADFITGFAPLTFQNDPGVAFDGAGHSFLSTLSGNVIFDVFNGYINNDTEIEVVQGFAHGAYVSVIPTAIDDQQCDGPFPNPFCPAVLDKPLITVDNVASSPSNGAIYVYYTLFCNGAGARGHAPCEDGSAKVPALSSAILESHSPGAGKPFTAPALVSGSLKNAQFSSMVIDSHGTPHIFFDDFSNPSFVNMHESTLIGGNWAVATKPVATFAFHGLSNGHWSFRDAGAQAPGCGIHLDTAYCAFSANQIADGEMESTPSVYLAIVGTGTATSSIHRVNDDPFNHGKHHFFAWATATSDGAVYVGWYDDRHDPSEINVEYFAGRSDDGGTTFPKQRAVSDASFNPCIGFPGCIFFGDYTQLVSGPDGVVHAAWTDTRNGSMQIFTQAIAW